MTPETLYENFFASENITPTRLHNFADDAKQRFMADTENGGWREIVDMINPAADALGRELGEVDTTVNVRLGHTDTVDAVIAAFADYMSENEPFIARALHGKGGPAYLEFFPAGITEYNRANKTTMPTLLERVATAAGKYNTELGEDISTPLREFQPQYERARGTQQGTKGQVADNRAERSEAREALEKILLRALFKVGDKYPGDVEKCKSYFDFRRLYSAGRHRRGTAGGQNDEV